MKDTFLELRSQMSLSYISNFEPLPLFSLSRFQGPHFPVFEVCTQRELLLLNAEAVHELLESGKLPVVRTFRAAGAVSRSGKKAVADSGCCSGPRNFCYLIGNSLFLNSSN
jgi:hypothetical protein